MDELEYRKPINPNKRRFTKMGRVSRHAESIKWKALRKRAIHIQSKSETYETEFLIPDKYVRAYSVSEKNTWTGGKPKYVWATYWAEHF